MLAPIPFDDPIKFIPFMFTWLICALFYFWAQEFTEKSEPPNNFTTDYTSYLHRYIYVNQALPVYINTSHWRKKR